MLFLQLILKKSSWRLRKSFIDCFVIRWIGRLQSRTGLHGQLVQRRSSRSVCWIHDKDYITKGIWIGFKGDSLRNVYNNLLLVTAPLSVKKIYWTIEVVVVFGSQNTKAQSQFSQTGLKTNLRLTLAPFHALISIEVTSPEVKLKTEPEIELILRIILA